MELLRLEQLLPVNGRWRTIIKQYLAEDIPTFDIGGFVVGESEEIALLICKSPGKLAGIPFFTAIFEECGCQVEWNMEEGDIITDVVTVATVRGPCRKILQGERTALNIISRASGIATEAANVAIKGAQAGWKGEIAGTRKTTPGFRLVEKYALLVGGVSTHRMDLSSMVMLKDNHIWACGSITRAVQRARKACGFSTKIEVEARSLEEAKEAAEAGADVVMLDNYKPVDLERDAKALKEMFPAVLIEASGGIRAESITEFMLPHVDIISMGKLTQGYPTVDFSLKIQSNQGRYALERAQEKHSDNTTDA